ncbi:unnamed protein product, partial [Sphagnum jensenii]
EEEEEEKRIFVQVDCGDGERGRVETSRRGIVARVGVTDGGGGGGRGGGGSSACQECGNQAKKDCSYQRCRTCCKSRGFECSTHLKSTWVPAAKRRERQAAEASATSSGGLLLHRPGKSKHARTTTIATALGGLPPEVRAQALFKCVRLMGVEDSENEFAYQATVKIGGHIFKGVLYDQGVDNGQAAAAAPSPSALGELQLGGGNSRGGGMPSSSSALIDPSSSLYGSGSALLGGNIICCSNSHAFMETNPSAWVHPRS